MGKKRVDNEVIGVGQDEDFQVARKGGAGSLRGMRVTTGSQDKGEENLSGNRKPTEPNKGKTKGKTSSLEEWQFTDDKQRENEDSKGTAAG